MGLRHNEYPLCLLGFTSRRRKAPGRCLSNAVPEREATAKVARLRVRFPFWGLRRTDTLAPSPCTGHRGWVTMRSGRCPIALLPGTFQGQFAFHSLQADTYQDSRLMRRWSRMPNWSSNASRETVQPGRSLYAATRAASSTFVTGLRGMERKPRICRRKCSYGCTAR